MKQLSSMMVGLACSGSSTPPMPTPPERCTFLPIWAQEPTVAQVSTMVPAADIGAEIDERGHQHDAGRDIGRAAHDGAGHGPEAGLLKSSAVMPANLEGTLSHQLAPPGAPAIGSMSLRRNDSRTAFLSHWFTTQAPSVFSATRALPLSSRSSAVSTASRTSPRVAGLTVSRCVPGGFDDRSAGRCLTWAGFWRERRGPVNRNKDAAAALSMFPQRCFTSARSPGLDFGHMGEGAAGFSCACGCSLGLSRLPWSCAPVASLCRKSWRWPALALRAARRAAGSVARLPLASASSASASAGRCGR